MKVQITRVISGKDGTFGVLSIEGKPICVTCEDPWSGNRPNVSCIPPGHYIAQSFSGARFKRTWEVLNVPERTAILFHHGNTTDDTRGCILPGLAFGKLHGKPAVMSSLQAMELLRGLLPGEFELTITQQPRLT